MIRRGKREKSWVREGKGNKKRIRKKEKKKKEEKGKKDGPNTG